MTAAHGAAFALSPSDADWARAANSAMCNRGERRVRHVALMASQAKRVGAYDGTQRWHYARKRPELAPIRPMRWRSDRTNDGERVVIALNGRRRPGKRRKRSAEVLSHVK